LIPWSGSLESCGARTLQSRLFAFTSRQVVQSRQVLVAPKAAQRDFLFLPRLETNRRARRNIEPEAKSGCTVEIDKLSGNVRISPPTPAVAKVPPRGLKEWT